ncbi:MAG TPA: L-serine ammonia-lyase, iron-sulfur-dependent, subunit alpha [Bacillota bacterium]|nr:L-serine ammonia-lyase, iron-sulfur-dependent, subunit alpha [Bacillota bacterium]
MSEDMFIRILEREMIPALGCTDPAGVAFAAAYAKMYAHGRLQSVAGELSPNIIKNAAAVCIPRTGGKCGISLAVAVGAIGGNAEKGLEVLSDITEEDVREAEKFIENGLINLNVSQNEKKLFMKLTVTTDQDEVTVTVEDSYTEVTSVTVNQNVVFCKDTERQAGSDGLLYDLSLERILGFVNEVSLEKLEIIKRAVKMNMAIAEEGISKDYGVSVGKSIQDFVQEGKMAEDYASTAMMWTAAATDARMAGCEIPVISNTGSGNQGLASTIPVISIANKMNADYEKMIRAVAVSSLVTIYIKDKLGVLSAVCGAVIAGAGTSCGVVYLLGGGKENMLTALQNTLGDIAGMLCDGAKAGCALKVATCTNTAVMAALMAMNNSGIKGTDGIVGYSEEQTIENFIKVATDGMNKMDQVILDIILKKEGNTV